MGVTGNKMKADDPRIGFTPADIAYLKFASHPKNITEVPTAQEVADRALTPTPTPTPTETELEPDEDVPVTEEQRLKKLLASFAKLIWEYFCQGNHAA